MKRFLFLIGIILISGNSVFAQCGYHAPKTLERQKSSVVLTETEEEKNFKKLSTISKKEAKKAAIEKYPGKVKKAELMKEENTLVWKLEIKGNEGQKEIFIDPSNGNFLGYGLTK